jgi:hypothetical protein
MRRPGASYALPMPREAWGIGGVAAAGALAVLALAGSPPAASPGAAAVSPAGFPLCPAVGRTRPLTASDRNVAQAVAVSYVAAIVARDPVRAVGFADAGSVPATVSLARVGLRVPRSVQPSAGPAAPLAHDPLGRAIAGRCGVDVLASTVAVTVRLGAAQPTVRALLIRRPERFLVFSLR